MGSNPWRKYKFWKAIVVTTIVLWVWRHSSFRSLSWSHSPSSGWRTVNASWLLKLACLDTSLSSSFLSRRLHYLPEGNLGRSVFVTLWLCFGWPTKNCTILPCCKFLFLTIKQRRDPRKWAGRKRAWRIQISMVFNTTIELRSGSLTGTKNPWKFASLTACGLVT